MGVFRGGRGPPIEEIFAPFKYSLSSNQENICNNMPLKIPLHLKCVAKLPTEMSVS